MTDTTSKEIDQQISDLKQTVIDTQTKIQELQTQAFEQQIYNYFAQLPQDQIMAAIGKILTSNPVVIMIVKKYIQDNPVPTPTDQSMQKTSQSIQTEPIQIKPE